MKKIVTMFTDSAKEFANLRSLVAAALLLALHTVLALFVSLQVSDSLRISFSFITNVVTGAFFGPVMGFVCGGLGDVIQFILKPTGAFNPGLTLSSAIAGLIYGLFFYRKFPSNVKDRKFKALDLKFMGRCILGITTDVFIVNILLSTYWITLLITAPGESIAAKYIALLGPRVIKNLIQLPVNIILSYYVLAFVRNIHLTPSAGRAKSKVTG